MGASGTAKTLILSVAKQGSYVDKIEFEKLVASALRNDQKKHCIARSTSIPMKSRLKQPPFPMVIKGESAEVAAWQISVPIAPLRHLPKSRVKIEFANVPSYDSGTECRNGRSGACPNPGRYPPQLKVLNEILADKAVALTARQALKYRDVWDVWYLTNKLNAQIDRSMVADKFADYGTPNVDTKAKQRREQLTSELIAKAFLEEMKRFLPAKRVSEIDRAGLQQSILATSVDLIDRAVLPPA